MAPQRRWRGKNTRRKEIVRAKKTTPHSIGTKRAGKCVSELGSGHPLLLLRKKRRYKSDTTVFLKNQIPPNSAYASEGVERHRHEV